MKKTTGNTIMTGIRTKGRDYFVKGTFIRTFKIGTIEMNDFTVDECSENSPFAVGEIISISTSELKYHIILTK